jgi:single-strand DNA-binding protein
MNIIALAGTLQSEPELRYTQDGLARISVMLNFASEREEEGDYKIRVIAFGNLAEEVHQNYHHGDTVFVEGRLQIEKRSKPSATTREEMEKKETVAELIARKFHRSPGSVSESLPIVQKTSVPSVASASRMPAKTAKAMPSSTKSMPPPKTPVTVDNWTPDDEIDLPF